MYIGLDFGTSGARGIAIDGALTPLYDASRRDWHVCTLCLSRVACEV